MNGAVLLNIGPHSPSHFGIRGDWGTDRNTAVLGDLAGDVADAVNVDEPVPAGKSQLAGQVLTYGNPPEK